MTTSRPVFLDPTPIPSWDKPSLVQRKADYLAQVAFAQAKHAPKKLKTTNFTDSRSLGKRRQRLAPWLSRLKEENGTWMVEDETAEAHRGVAEEKKVDEFRIVQANAREGTLFFPPSQKGDGSQRRCGRSQFVSWVRSMDVDVLVIHEVVGVSNETLHEVAGEWGHARVWRGELRSGYDVAVTCRACVVSEVRRLGLGHWGRFIEYPTVYRHGGYGLALVDEVFGSLPLIVAQLDTFFAKARAVEAIALSDELSSHLIYKHSALVVVADAGASRSDAVALQRAVHKASAMNQDDPVRSAFESSHTGVVFEATDALATTLVDLGALFDPSHPQSYSVPTLVTDPTRTRHAAAVSLALSALRVDYMYGTEKLVNRTARHLIVRNEFTATLFDHYPLLLDLRQRKKMDD